MSADATTTRRELLAAVEDRRQEMVDAIFARTQAIGSPGSSPDPDYLEGLRRTVEVAVDHTIEAAGRDAGWPLSVPDEILAQARLAARRRVSLDTVLRRYLAGHSMLSDFVVEEASRRNDPPTLLRGMLRAMAAESDRVFAAISDTYAEAAQLSQAPSVDRQRAESVRRLLDGELIELGHLGYEFDNFHLGIVGRGSETRRVFADLVRAHGAASLAVTAEDGVLWGWIGRSEPLDPDLVTATFSDRLPPGSRVGVGEPAEGRTGWRFTHEQARAAISVAERSSKDHALRYAGVALLASAISDELLISSLQSLYLDPLADECRDPDTLRETLRAYLATGRSATSTAAALGVTRTTVANRIRMIEARIGHLTPSVFPDLALALRVDEFT